MWIRLGAIRIQNGDDHSRDVRSANDIRCRNRCRELRTVQESCRTRRAIPLNGCAICEVEIDPDTGAIEIVRYASIDDAGQAINPLILHGQVHGGIVQGLGQALLEDVVYSETGQVLSGSFMDYALPRARHVPSFAVELAEDPTKGNPLRVKGGGEAGITPALAVVMNAIMDALKDYGVEHIDMPATPHRIWSAIQAAKGNQ